MDPATAVWRGYVEAGAAGFLDKDEAVYSPEVFEFSVKFSMTFSGPFLITFPMAAPAVPTFPPTLILLLCDGAPQTNPEVPVRFVTPVLRLADA